MNTLEKIRAEGLTADKLFEQMGRAVIALEAETLRADTAEKQTVGLSVKAGELAGKCHNLTQRNGLLERQVRILARWVKHGHGCPGPEHDRVCATPTAGNCVDCVIAESFKDAQAMSTPPSEDVSNAYVDAVFPTEQPHRPSRCCGNCLDWRGPTAQGDNGTCTTANHINKRPSLTMGREVCADHRPNTPTTEVARSTYVDADLRVLKMFPRSSNRRCTPRRRIQRRIGTLYVRPHSLVLKKERPHMLYGDLMAIVNYIEAAMKEGGKE